MKQRTSRVGLYSKVVLAAIAVSLLAFLVKWIPVRTEAKQGLVADIIVVTISHEDQLNCVAMRIAAERLGILKELNNQIEKAGYDDPRDYIWRMPSGECLEILLEILCNKGYEMKFVTDDFIILESPK